MLKDDDKMENDVFPRKSYFDAEVCIEGLDGTQTHPSMKLSGDDLVKALPLKNQQEIDVFRKIYENSIACGCDEKSAPYIITPPDNKTVICFSARLDYRLPDRRFPRVCQGACLETYLLLDETQKELFAFDFVQDEDEHGKMDRRNIEYDDHKLISQHNLNYGEGKVIGVNFEEATATFVFSQQIDSSMDRAGTDCLWREILRFINSAKIFTDEYREIRRGPGYAAQFTSGQAVFCRPRKP